MKSQPWFTSCRESLESPESDLNRRPLPYHGSALPTELSGREPHCSEGCWGLGDGGSQGWSERRWPFMRAAESEQRKAIASARSSAGVKVGRSTPGLDSRIWGVSMALTTMMLAVALVPMKESARARVQASAAALAEA